MYEKSNRHYIFERNNRFGHALLCRMSIRHTVFLAIAVNIECMYYTICVRNTSCLWELKIDQEK